MIWQATLLNPEKKTQKTDAYLRNTDDMLKAVQCYC